MPCETASWTAGRIMFFSSSPSSPPSPQCGFRPSTAIFGVSTPKSLSSDFFISFSLLTIFSFVIAVGTAFKGMCPVTTPTLRVSLTIIMQTSSTPNSFSRYSVCPVNPKPSFAIALLLKGAVTSTSISPFFMSVTACSNAIIADFADSGVDCPGSTYTLSGKQLTMFTLFGCTSFAEVMTLVFTGLSRL